jgi:hypothetical protein
MKVDHEELMRWAKEQAPIWANDGLGYSDKRPVRLVIRAHSFIDGQIVATVYLREPRCQHPYTSAIHAQMTCECGPIAERRLS